MSDRCVSLSSVQKEVHFRQLLISSFESSQTGERLSRKAIARKLEEIKPGRLFSPTGQEITRVEIVPVSGRDYGLLVQIHEYSFRIVTSIRDQAQSQLYLNISVNKGAPITTMHIRQWVAIAPHGR